jgi:hypothetical protein
MQSGSGHDAANVTRVAAPTGIVWPTLAKCTTRHLRQFQLDWEKFSRDRLTHNADPANPRIAKTHQRDCFTPQLLEGLVAAQVFEGTDKQGESFSPLTSVDITATIIDAWLKNELEGNTTNFSKVSYDARMVSVSCPTTEPVRVVQLLVDYQNTLADLCLQALTETATKMCVEEFVEKLRPWEFKEHVSMVLSRQRELKRSWNTFTKWVRNECREYDKYTYVHNRSRTATHDHGKQKPVAATTPSVLGLPLASRTS